MPVRTAVAVQHVLFEDLGILKPLLAEHRYRIHTLDATCDDIAVAAGADLVIVLGGPIGVRQASDYPFLDQELAMLATRLAAGLPTLGICLGAQLMAHALGAQVYAGPDTEIGFAPVTLSQPGRDSVLASLADVPVLHWHGDTFDLPEGTQSLAATPGFPNQAFAVGANALALQFHLETDLNHLERWLVGHSGELSDHGISVTALRAQAREVGPRLHAAATTVFDEWLSRLPRH